MLTALSHFLRVFDGEQCRPQLPTAVLIYYTVCLAKKKKKKKTHPNKTGRDDGVLGLQEEIGIGHFMPCTAVPEQLCDKALIIIIVPCGPLVRQ